MLPSGLKGYLLYIIKHYSIIREKVPNSVSKIHFMLAIDKEYNSEFTG